MNVLFLTLVTIDSINDGGIYNDLLRTINDNGHHVYVLCPDERRNNQGSSIQKFKNVTILRVRSLNIQKTNTLEKGVSTLTIEYLYLMALHKYLKNVKYNLVLYSTPPVTFSTIVKYIKKRDDAKSYLLLKDIFPQNAVDMRMMERGSIVHKYFKRQERTLYSVSDFIGCMSEANKQYLLDSEVNLSSSKIELNPNSIIPSNTFISRQERAEIRDKYHIPQAAVLFLYGGNLGVPQGVGFLLEVVDRLRDQEEIFILIVGSGTKYSMMQEWFDENQPSNAKILGGVSKKRFDMITRASDVGMIFLDRRFTIPNYPSRLLAYMDAKIPIIMGIDTITDIGREAEANNYGLWSKSGDLDHFIKNVDLLTRNPTLRMKMGQTAHRYLLENYTSQRSYDIIMDHM